jgi:hypothetical protein
MTIDLVQSQRKAVVAPPTTTAPISEPKKKKKKKKDKNRIIMPDDDKPQQAQEESISTETTQSTFVEDLLSDEEVDIDATNIEFGVKLRSLTTTEPVVEVFKLTKALTQLDCTSSSSCTVHRGTHGPWL